jgi:hypothetical protein
MSVNINIAHTPSLNTDKQMQHDVDLPHSSSRTQPGG